MGSSTSAQWKPPNDKYIVMDYKYCRVWVRKEDKVQHLEEYPLRVQTPKQLQRYQSMFVLRMDQVYFPLTLYFINNSSNFMCGGTKMGSILIQRIPYRLCQFTNIPYNEAISILFFAFKGYHILHQKYGPFRVKSTMIGLDLLYKIKVWHHTDLSSPEPQDPYCHTAFEMINSIVRSVENVSVCPYEMPRFSQFLEIKKVELYGFELAVKMIEQYAEQFHIRIQHKFDMIEKYLKQAAGIMPSSNKVFNAKSSSKVDFYTPEKSKNRSLNKFSFKSNKVIEVQESGSQQRLINNTYYNTSILSPRQSSFNREEITVRNQSITKIIPPPLSPRAASPQKNHRFNMLDDRTAANTRNQSLTRFTDYGLEKNLRPTPFFTSHSRAASKLQKVYKQSTKDSSTFIPAMHARAASDFNRVRKAEGKPYSPYYDNTETKSGEDSSSRSFKTLISADSYSFTVDGELKSEMINMLRNKH